MEPPIPPATAAAAATAAHISAKRYSGATAIRRERSLSQYFATLGLSARNRRTSWEPRPDAAKNPLSGWVGQHEPSAAAAAW